MQDFLEQRFRVTVLAWVRPRDEEQRPHVSRLAYMTDAPTTDLGPQSRDEQKDELDPELLELPDPPKRGRTVTIALLLFTALCSVLMLLALRRDAAYAFAPTDARDVGDLTTVKTGDLGENQYVHANVTLGSGGAIRYERPLVSDSFRLMPVAGRDDVWVEVRVPPRGENVRWVPPTQVSGRLVHFESAGPRHRGLASAVKETKQHDVPKDAWLLVDSAAPGDARWAVVLCVLFASFAAWNAFATAKLLRKVDAA